MNLDSALRPWLRRASTLVADRLADARAHAAAGSLPVAHRRLVELQLALGRHYGDARAAFVRTSVGSRTADVPVEYRSNAFADGAATAAAERAATTVPIAGADHYAELDALIEAARAELRAVVAIGTDDPTNLALWESRHRDKLNAAVGGHLSDAQIALYEAIGRLLIDPSIR